MSKSFQHEKPPARVNLFLEVATGGAQKKVELPLRMLVMGDFLGRPDDTPLADREVININKDNFDDVMRSSNLSMDINVKDRLREGGDDFAVHLDLETLKSFRPEEVAHQVPQLSKLLAARNLLQDLRNRIISVSDFRKQLESVIKDEALRARLLSELDQVVTDEGDAEGEEGAGDDA